ncbi:MAG: glycosyltransferase family 4 protein [Planctomycetaceae bacterium]|jgi:glycosyltransferase involved in cell wall biosynthesis|nr:glycosyltransferase family 4 protein [Planctomycetaceae bacterium]
MKLRLIFDISPIGFTTEVTGISRFTIEVLRRLINRNIFDITLISPYCCEEDALRNYYNIIGQKNIPFQSKEIEHYILPSKKRSNSLFGYMEEVVHNVIPESNWLDSMIENARKIKRKIIPPNQATIDPTLKRQRFPLLEYLIRNSDAYFSPYYAMINEIDVNPTIKKLQVIHDLTPILFPHLFSKNWSIEWVAWHNITPDMYVLTDSQCTKNDLLRHYPHISENNVTTISLGADEFFCPCTDRIKIESVLKKYGLSKNTNYILSVATLEIRKNFDHVIRSFAMFIEQYGDQFPNLNLVLTGKKGWLDKRIYTVYNRLTQKIKKRIIFTGYVDDTDLPFLYNGAVCFCYMSIYEGFGLPPLEAMQCGTPVITSNTSSLPEVVGDAGIMLDPYNVEGLADAFMQVISNENLRQEMIAKGLEQAKKFNWDDCVDLIVKKIIN